MRGSVLIVDDDQDISLIVAEALQEEGFTVAELADLRTEAIHAAVRRLEPDIVLLDGANQVGFGQSWVDAAWMHARERPLAVIMFTVHAQDVVEGRLGESERSQRAAFVGFITKPFDLQELIDVVACAVQEPASVLGLRPPSRDDELTVKPGQLRQPPPDAR